MPVRRRRAALDWVLVAVTLFSLLGMHSLTEHGVTGAHPDGGGTHHPSVEAAGGPTVLARVAIEVQVLPSARTAPCSGGACHGSDGHQPGGAGHTVAHLCLAVLAGAVALFVTVALGRSDTASTLIRERLAAAGRMTWRAPPWTRLSLAQLSVLRV